jgi:hypothetical protein
VKYSGGGCLVGFCSVQLLPRIWDTEMSTDSEASSPYRSTEKYRASRNDSCIHQT